MIGKIFDKNNVDWENYAEAAEWCNSNDATIVERENYYEVVSNSDIEEEVKEDKT